MEKLWRARGDGRENDDLLPGDRQVVFAGANSYGIAARPGMCPASLEKEDFLYCLD